ncbi:TNF receptor-associated factor 3 [Anopheles bellator]|uniref:TNF receptor-associated factor 3 n=1 Tax=Anopheles bellator TaxID=139047 RepID=UPI00264A2042|nr:TNF receptor-associated factor 3 [Anopheles bellator]
MSDGSGPRVQFTKTSCYLCSEWLSDDAIEQHLQECNRVLDLCPEGCGLLVLRRDLASHKNRCAAGFSEDGETATVNHQQPTTTINHTDTPVFLPPEPTIVGGEVNELRRMLLQMHQALGEEMVLRTELLDQVRRLKQRLELADQWTVKVNEALVSMNKLVNEEANRRSVAVRSLERRQELLEAWRLDITTRFNVIESKPGVVREGIHASVAPSDGGGVRSSVQSVGGHLEQECPELQRMVESLAERQAKTACRVQDALRQTFEGEERVQVLSGQVEKYRRETYYTKQRLDSLQAQLLHEDRLSGISSQNGRCVWHIGGFEQRFSESQEHDTMLKGPVFTHQPFGYVLQMEVSLYGIGTWRGRNMIVGLTVLRGPHDPLLQWPCRLPGTVYLRDQPDNGATACDFSKPILAKRQSQQHDRHQYVYIPHATVRSQHFLRDDAIFLEVVLDRRMPDGDAVT